MLIPTYVNCDAPSSAAIGLVLFPFQIIPTSHIPLTLIVILLLQLYHVYKITKKFKINSNSYLI